MLGAAELGVECKRGVMMTDFLVQSGLINILFIFIFLIPAGFYVISKLEKYLEGRKKEKNLRLELDQMIAEQKERAQERQDELDRIKMKNEHELERMRREMEREREHNDYRRMKIEKEHLTEIEKEKMKIEKEKSDREKANSFGSGSGGYIFLDMSDTKRSIFCDLLKGFEEYSKLKGYVVTFSFDSSFNGKIAFKFTVIESGVNVSTETVRKDLKEYIEKLQSNTILEGMPIVLSEKEHDAVFGLLKDRIEFIKQHYDFTQKTQFYENLLSKISSQPLGVLPSANFYLQTGGKMDSRNYEAVNSSNIAQGDGNKLIDSSIYIGESFNDKKEQIEKLSQLINSLKTNEDLSDEKDKALNKLEKVKDELTDENNPDKAVIKKWLVKSKEYLSNIKKSKDLFEQVKELYESFNLSSLLTNLL